MNRLTLAAGLAGFLAVALGAFGAHGLEAILTGEAKAWWETATLYALTHAVAALALSVSGQTRFIRGGWAFIVGAALFSGSLYAMALGAPRMLGMVTPLGGVTLLAGWIMTMLAATKKP